MLLKKEIQIRLKFITAHMAVIYQKQQFIRGRIKICFDDFIISIVVKLLKNIFDEHK